jgi:hypothetical protein
MKKITTFLVTLFVFLLYATSVKAVVNPADGGNNVFGIHIHDESDLEDAAKLVNSKGGDWGYVTIVIRKDDRNTQKWQETFDKMRRLHLIPILRIATRQQNGGWEKPSFDEIDGWVSFLNNLNWVIKNRYVIIGNEPNHTKEWGNELNPEEYANYLYQFSSKLKETSDEFYILPAGFDASAPSDKLHLDEAQFLQRMLNENPSTFEHIDGWNSHSYPNPNFSASATKSGRGSIRTYEWELDLLKNMGLDKKLPIFITETGWIHSKNGRNGNLSPSTISERFITAFENVWLTNNRIIAITPFILNYQESPFDIFSWKDNEGKYYEFYYKVQNINKEKGEPLQNRSLHITAILFPKVIKKGDLSYGIAYAKNTGQSIWKQGNIETIKDGIKAVKMIPIHPKTIEPQSSGLIYLSENINASE